MHRRAFHPSDERKLTIDQYGYELFYKEHYDKNYAEELGFSIWDNPDGMDVLLTNLGFKNLRVNKDEEQTHIHFNWDEAKKLRDYLNKVIEEHDKRYSNNL